MNNPRTVSRVLVAVAGAAALAAAGTTGVASAAPPNSGPWCATGDLAPGTHALSPGAGQRYVALTLTNTSGHTCHTRGYVGLQLQDSAGAPLPTNVVRDTSQSPVTVTVGPGESVWTRLHFTAVPGPGEPTDGPCQPTPTASQVTPPDEYTQLVTGWDYGPVCGGGTIDVTPLGWGSGPDY